MMGSGWIGMRQNRARRNGLALLAILLIVALVPAVRERVAPTVPALALGGNPTVTIGPEQYNDPYNCWTDGAFGMTAVGATINSFSPVNANACDQFKYTGPDVDHLNATTPLTGLTYGPSAGHYDHNEIYDGLGWWPYALWVDTSTTPNTWYTYAHTEDGHYCVPNDPNSGDLRTIGVWTSTNQGASWTYQGVGIDAWSGVGFSAPTWDCYSETIRPRVLGTGDQKFIVGQDSYNYILYTEFGGGIGVARSLKTDNGRPGTWYKYYNGTWTQPGVAGNETWVVSGGQHSVIWSTYLNKYVMVYQQGKWWITYSTDLVNWSTPDLLYDEGVISSTDGNSTFIAYTNLVGIGSGSSGTDATTGRSVWLYYNKGNKGYEMDRRLLSFDNQTNLAANKSVTTSSNFASSASSLSDTDKSTCFCPTATSTAYNGVSGWASVDLGSQQTFNEVKLYPYTGYGYGFPQDFSIQGSNTSATGPWTTIQSYSAYPQPKGNTQVLSLGAQSYRYVQLNVTGVTGSAEKNISPTFVPAFSLRLMEMEVYNDTQGPPPNPTACSAPNATYFGSTGFSSTQGQNQWAYEYEAALDIGTGDQLSAMTYDSGNSRWAKSGSFSIVANNWQHPDIAKDSSRVWRAPCNGAIHITGQVKKGDTGGGNGVQVRVKKNRTTIWPAGGGWQSIAYNDSTGYAVDVYTSVSAGDRIFFTVNANGNISNDTTSWDPRIDYNNVQGTYTASTGFSSTNGGNQLAYQYFNGTTYADMTWDSGSSCWIRSGTLTKNCKNLQHPDVSSDSVRIWIAPHAGWASVTGNVKKGDASGGDGVLVQVRKGPPTLLWSGTIGYNDAAGLNTGFTYPVVAGDMFLFIVDYNANVSYDTTIWDPTVTLSY